VSIDPIHRIAVTTALVVLMGATALGTVGTQVAAAAQAPSTSLAGSYFATTYNKNGFVIPAGPLTLNRDGHFQWGFKGAAGHGTWSESSDVATLTGEGTQMKDIVFTAHVFGLNLGIKSHPGLMKYQGHRLAKWYALSCADPSSPCY
jgi:hypothetical protein